MYLILLSQRHQKSAAGNFRLLSSSSIQTCQQTFSVLVLRSPLQSGLQTANPPALQLRAFNSTASKLLQTSREFLPLLTRNGYPSDVSAFGGEQYPSDLLRTVWCLVFPPTPLQAVSKDSSSDLAMLKLFFIRNSTYLCDKVKVVLEFLLLSWRI